MKGVRSLAKKDNAVTKGVNKANVPADASSSFKPQHVNIWHTQAAQNHDFREDLRKLDDLFPDYRMGREL